MIFAREAAGFIREAGDIDACTFEAFHDRLIKQRAFEGYPEPKHLHFELRQLIGEMTLLTEFYNFLPCRMSAIYQKKDLVLGNNPRVRFQRLGLFEEEDPNAPRGVSRPFRGEVPTADCLCDVLGVEIDWTMSVADHLKFDEPKRQLTLFTLPSFCKIIKQSPYSVLSRQVLVASRHSMKEY